MDHVVIKNSAEKKRPGAMGNRILGYTCTECFDEWHKKWKQWEKVKTCFTWIMASLLILIIVIAIVTDENSHGHSIPLGS